MSAPPRTEAVAASREPSARGAGLRRLWAAPRVRWGVLLLAATTAFAFLGGLLAPFDPSQPVGAPYAPPSPGIWLGTDQLGRDVLSRVLHGGAYLAWMAPTSAVLAVAIGAAVGLAAAYWRGWVDTLLMRAMDVVLAFPGILLTLLFVAVFGPLPWLLVTLVVVALVPGVARVIRGAALPVIGREYVQWAKAVGMPSATILRTELLPNVSSPLFVELGVRLMWAVGILASMSFIGYGIQPPAADWGLMVSENRTGLGIQPLAVLAPVVMIVVYTVSGNLIAEGAARVIARTEGRAE
ncbi:ABC transporter permease [Agromyces soli]|uniref:ABC transporter permease n=1 Tax=Agromyces soli TaxID=659012 RepID=A0ABY4B136_9MICO|nr:ABC transporter permease [Agromyces soli]UOE27783.1 ABC transporter permease [Agromyces soli]